MAGRKSKYSSENSNENKIKIWQVAIYIRLSQEDSNNGEGKIESNSVTSQKTLINEFVEENDEYARDTSIKIKSSLNGMKKRGEFVGSFASYGYVKDVNDKHKLVIDEEEAKVVKNIFEWKVNEGLGNLAICHRLNNMGVLNPTGHKKKKLNQNYNNSKMKKEDYSWCPSTVRNILKNDVYIGNVTQGKRKVKSYKIHKIEQVPEEEWVTVENMHKTYSKSGRIRK